MSDLRELFERDQLPQLSLDPESLVPRGRGLRRRRRMATIGAGAAAALILAGGYAALDGSLVERTTLPADTPSVAASSSATEWVDS